MKTLTVFTPAYNRGHTIGRTYESLLRQTSNDFEWLVIDDGSTDNTRELVEEWIAEGRIQIRYIYQENGGLYTGYNTAYANIETELCVCIDSDDYMPDDAVEFIVSYWRENGHSNLAGITGLDYYLNGVPIGGMFPEWLHKGHLIDLIVKKIHSGDTKQVMRTALMKSVSPLVGFPGEKNLNPAYMFLQIDNEYPSLFVNKNLCFVDYQENDSMSAQIFRQYLNSPKSFAKTRLLYMSLNRSTIWYKIRNAIHYNSSCIISRDKDWLANSPLKIITVLTRPLGWILTKYIEYKVKKM